MKRLLGITLTMSVSLVACGNDDFEKYVSEGNKAIKQEKYELAINSFEKALQEKDDKEVKELLEETKNIVDAQNAFNNYKLGTAMNLVHEVETKSDSKELAEQADDLEDAIKREFDAKLQKAGSLISSRSLDEADEVITVLEGWMNESEELSRDFETDYHHLMEGSADMGYRIMYEQGIEEIN